LGLLPLLLLLRPRRLLRLLRVLVLLLLLLWWGPWPPRWCTPPGPRGTQTLRRAAWAALAGRPPRLATTKGAGGAGSNAPCVLLKTRAP
jgi:hypothetical protein